MSEFPFTVPEDCRVERMPFHERAFILVYEPTGERSTFTTASGYGTPTPPDATTRQLAWIRGRMATRTREDVERERAEFWAGLEAR